MEALILIVVIIVVWALVSLACSLVTRWTAEFADDVARKRKR